MSIKSIEINGWPIEYVESGDPNSPALILLHGWAQDHRLFNRLEPYLTDQFRVFRLNFRGHDGKLTKNGDFSAEDLVGDVLEFIRRLQLRDARVASTSHGCWVNIGVQEELGDEGFGRAVVIDWLMQPFDGFRRQISEGMHPTTVWQARQNLFDEWTEGSDCLPVIDHVNREMTWFGEEMWMRACREIDRAYETWGDPLQRMASLSPKVEVAHIYSQPLAEEYRDFQEEYGSKNAWFTPIHIPGQTHFPTLENPAAVASAIAAYLS